MMAPLRYLFAEKTSSSPAIIDIRREKLSISLEDEILKGLVGKSDGEKSMPTLLLYSAEGLKLFEDITYLDEYYLTNAEIEVLEKYADEMADRVQDGSIVVELGSGNLRKVNIFLEALDRKGKRIDYYALDLDLSELERTLGVVPTFRNVQYHGLHGTYEDGRAWLNDSPMVRDRPRCILWLGSSIGNFKRSEAAEFLRSFAGDTLRPGTHDCMLVGLDGCKDGDRVYTAYNDPKKLTERFIMSGLSNTNRILGDEYFHLDDWDYLGEWNAEEGRHQAYYVPKKDIRFGGKLAGVNVKKGERVHIEYSYKFDDEDLCIFWEEAGLAEATQWSNGKGDYHLHMVQKPSFAFYSKPEKYMSQVTPTMDEWRKLWASWDKVTGMIPKDQLLSKPIDLRNPCIFYIGHIPTFVDSLIIRVTMEEPTEPKHYLDIFQRGIDPDIDDPRLCHPHSIIPESWPELDEILQYKQEVRDRVGRLYKEDSAAHQPPEVQRILWIGFEHEAMHLETLLYMLLQSDTMLPPSGVIIPDFASDKRHECRKEAHQSSSWVKIPKMTIEVGMDDREQPEDVQPHFFGWDNEKPKEEDRTVASFYTRLYPITNEEYANYLVATSSTSIPASWTMKDQKSEKGGIGLSEFMESIQVRTVFGPVPLKLALDWPVIASYDELQGCAHWVGGRIPTADEVRAIYQHAERGQGTMENELSKMISAVNGQVHLTLNGVCESPPTLPESRQQLFADLASANVGFKRWHPTSVRTSGGKLLGRGETGGAWEWTSTVLEPQEGFRPGRFYPQYTADFFDGKHNVVLGGSWATHPRIAGRKTFVNWYQRGYRYAWAAARVVKNC